MRPLQAISPRGLSGNIGKDVAGDAGGLFTLYADGKWDFDATDMIDDIGIGQSLVTTVKYVVKIEHAPGAFNSYQYGSQLAEGSIAFQVSKLADGSLAVIPEVPEIYFEEFHSYKYAPGDESSALWPDLQGYVDRLLGDMGIAGRGESVYVSNNGTVMTHGPLAHGVFAEATGGQGTHGVNGSFWNANRYPTPGGTGSNGGSITVLNDREIETRGHSSAGILLNSIGGKGGHGGNGSDWRYGKRGGTGGTGGEITVTGNGQIQTGGAYASGILVLSQGGIGGTGGSGAGTTGGGSGGFGGKGATSIGPFWSFGGDGGSGGSGGEVVVVNGSEAEIATSGSQSHAILAQSIGGGGGLAGNLNTGLSFSGSVGGDGSGGNVTITHTGSIGTFGDNSHGIFAQSTGGQNDAVKRQLGIMDPAGNLQRDKTGNIVFGPLVPLPDQPDLGGTIDVTVEGDIIVNGKGSHAIFAQSRGQDGNGDISVRISGGKGRSDYLLMAETGKRVRKPLNFMVCGHERSH